MFIYRLIGSAAVLLVGLAVVGWLMVRRPPSKEPLTWLRAMVGALGVFSLFLLGFAVVPHEWLNYADSVLGWGRRDLIVVDTPLIDVSRQAIRDVVVVGIYGFVFTATLALWHLWQRREQLFHQEKAPAAGRVPAGTSAYGRPLYKRAG